ncbi:MAG TPA: type II toxin-antitoxin system prevent-host-death family antitoxin [Gaiellaceae bacterium]|jgi:prevent-host-death family protein
MASMGIRELRDNLTAAVRRVRAGETIEVTHDGEPVAVLAPVRRDALDDLIVRGEARPATRPLDLSAPLWVNTSGKNVSESLDEQRDDRV